MESYGWINKYHNDGYDNDNADCDILMIITLTVITNSTNNMKIVRNIMGIKL